MRFFLFSVVCAAAPALAAAAAPAVAPALAPATVDRGGKASVVSEDPTGVTVTLEAPGLTWASGSGYLYPSIPGMGFVQETGQPALPVRSVRVAIPAGATPILTILEADAESGPSGRVGPVQNWVPIDPGSFDRVPFNEENETTYGADALYPAEQPVRLGVVGALREQPFVSLVFTPVLHNPARGTSVVYKSVTVRIDFGGASVSPGPFVADPAFEEIYDQGLVNARQARAFRGGSQPVEKTVDAPLSEGEIPPLDLVQRAAGPLHHSSLLVSLSKKYELTVRRDALYRLTPAWVTANAPNLTSFNPSKYRLDCLGVQVPITVVDADANGTFNGSDYIEFYGQALTWDILSADEWNFGDYTDDNACWLYADSGAVLRIPTASGTPTNTFTIPQDFSYTSHHEVDRRFVNQVPEDVVTPIVDHWYEEPPLSMPGGSGFPQATTPATTADFVVSTPGVSTTTPTASVKVRLLGDNYINNSHLTSILVNPVTNPAAVSGPLSWSGFMEFTQGPASFNQSVLNDGSPETTTVRVSLPGFDNNSDTFRDREIVFENWIDVTYGRKFRVDVDSDGDGTVTNDQMLTFSVPNANTQFHLTGLSQSSAVVYEITKTLSDPHLANPVRITGATIAGAVAPFTLDFQIAADGSLPATRRFIVATVTGGSTAGVLVPAGAREDNPVSCAFCEANLHAPSGGADWLVIANASFLDGAGGSAWQQLLTRRASQGLAVKVVDVEDVYDEFSYGVSDPQAIRDFIAYVYASWPRPSGLPVRYVVLIGDGSFDYKNSYLNPQSRNLLSPYMRSVSSSTVLGWMSDETFFSNVVGAPGDQAPDVYLGRWPVHSVAETDAIAQKILNYETAPTGQPWQSTALFIADNEAGFETDQNREIDFWLSPTCILCSYPSPWEYHRVYELALGTLETHARILQNLSGPADPSRDIGNGAAVVSYVGHGSWQVWGSNGTFFGTSSATPGDDVDLLTNGSKLPLVLVSDCLSGGFTMTSRPGGCSNDAARLCQVHADCVNPGTCTNPAPPSGDLRYVYSDDMLTTANRGAIGVMAPSHLTFSNEHTVALDTFFGEIYGPRKTRNLGALTQSIQLAYGDSDPLAVQSFGLFGDPAVNLLVPAPRPPTNVIATAGNRQVSLSWSASPDAPGATYNVYQADSANSSYTRIATNISATSFVSTNLQNCSTYYYFVATLKGGIEGGRSHLCGMGGSCLSASPTNPAAPVAPTGVAAVDKETGGAVQVQWTASPASEDVNEYRVYYGTSPNPSGTFISAGTATTLLVSGLTNGVTYYFAISATNCSHGEGPKSVATVSAIPRRIEGVKPPNAIEDLEVFRSVDAGDNVDDARLQWTPPASNIYAQNYPFGSPATTLASMEVYSGTTPNFAVDAAHKIGTVNCPCSSPTSFIHENGFEDSPNHYYLIVAVDSSGNRSGISNELPRGIDQMTLTKTGGTLHFSWPAVTLDIDGRKTQIASYSLYQRATTPMKRSDVGVVAPVQTGITGTSVNRATPAGSLFFWSVIAVDTKGALSPW